MPTRASLRATFRAYFEDIEKCVNGRAYWALLHLLIVLPDVCSAMEHPDGESDDRRYKKWCNRFLDDPMIKPNDWYRIRCLLLHQGRTRDDEGKSQYANFRFTHPQDEASNLHRHVETVPEGKLLHLDVKALAAQIQGAVEKWFDWVGKSADQKIAENVERNAKALAQKAVIQETPSSSPLSTMTISVTSSPQIR